MSFFDKAPVYMGIDLCGDYRAVPQHLLNSSQVGSPFKQMGGEGVPEGVRTAFFG